MGLRAADDAKLARTVFGCQPSIVILSEAKDLLFASHAADPSVASLSQDDNANFLTTVPER